MPDAPHIRYDVQHNGCIYNVGQWHSPAHKRMSVYCEVLDDEKTALDIAHLLAWRFENRETAIADVLPLDGTASLDSEQLREMWSDDSHQVPTDRVADL